MPRPGEASEHRKNQIKVPSRLPVVVPTASGRDDARYAIGREVTHQGWVRNTMTPRTAEATKSTKRNICAEQMEVCRPAGNR